mgnify:CR=1 FL=1
MIYIKPSFFDDFKCIADRCTDTCCAGWEVDIDENTLDFYKNAEGSYYDEIRKNITVSDDGSQCFKLCENDRCVFLNENNLCKIIMNCGEKALCEICKEHPRFYEWFPGVTECGLGLCCEEVCRLLLEKEDEVTLVESNDFKPIEMKDKEETVVSDMYIVISGLRQCFFDILFNKALTLNEKTEKIVLKTERFCSEELALRNTIEIVEAYKKTEPIDGEWTEYINNIYENVENYSRKRKELSAKNENNIFYSKILAYIFYRHLTKAAFDGDIASRVCFCLESMRFIELSDVKTVCEKGELTLWDRVENLKRWSKQVEYSEENTDYLIYGE